MNRTLFALLLVARHLAPVAAVATAAPTVEAQVEPAHQTGPAAPPADRIAGPLERVGEVEGGAWSWSPPFDRNGRTFFTIDEGGAARVWDARTLRPLAGLLHHKGVEYARLVDGGKTLFTAGGREVRFWDVATSKLRAGTQVAARELYFADASPDGTRFSVIAEEDTESVALWRVGEARPGAILRHALPLTGAWFDPGGTRIVTHGHGTPFHVWSADTARELYPPVPSDDRSTAPSRAEFDEGGSRLVMAQEKGFTVIDAATGRRLSEVQLPHPFYSGNVRLSPDGSRVAVGVTYRGPAFVFDALGKEQRQWGTDLTDCQILAGGRWALCSTVGREPADVQEVWDLTTGTKVQTIEQPGAARLSPDGSMVLIAMNTEVAAPTTAVWRVRKVEPEK